MGSVNRVYIARLARMLVLGPLGESVGRVRDVVISISIVRQQPRVLGLVVDLATRRSIFIPILRVAAIDPNALTLSTGSVSLRHFEQRPGEVLAIGQVLDTVFKVNDPELSELAGVDVVVTDPGDHPDPDAGLDGHPGRGAPAATAAPARPGARGGLAQRAGPDAVDAGAA